MLKLGALKGGRRQNTRQVRTSIRSVPPPRSLDESDLQPLRAFTSIAVLNLTSMPVRHCMFAMRFR